MLGVNVAVGVAVYVEVGVAEMNISRTESNDPLQDDRAVSMISKPKGTVLRYLRIPVLYGLFALLKKLPPAGCEINREWML
jgi:hypothetical protein